MDPVAEAVAAVIDAVRFVNSIRWLLFTVVALCFLAGLFAAPRVLRSARRVCRPARPELEASAYGFVPGQTQVGAR